jgi:hypothetical protein
MNKKLINSKNDPVENNKFGDIKNYYSTDLIFCGILK